MTRADLLALTPDALAALANRGLVKRATKELDSGAAPELAMDGDGTIRARFTDGTACELPAGAGLDGASCSCAAPGICRHRIGLILAYQRRFADEGGAEPAADGAAGWSPGGVTDETLTEIVGARAVTAARRTFNAGYPARIRRGTPADPVPYADLPTCTVRFLVPGDLSYVHTDAASARRGEVIALAVWAFRAADEREPGAEEVRLDVGGRPAPAAVGTGLEPAVELADELLYEGAMHAGPVLGGTLRRVRDQVADNGLNWPAGTLDELIEQLDGYATRSARYSAERFATLLTEIHARHRASAGGGSRSQVLGTDEPGDTALRRVRLVGLGCRIGGSEDERVAEVFLANAETGMVLVLRKRWEFAPGHEPPTGHDLSARRIGGAMLRALAAGNIVSESASRSASRVVRVAPGRIAKTTVTPVGMAWRDLPAPIVVRDLAAAGRAMDGLPPRLVRPRIEAEFVRVVEIAAVHEIGYHPGDQRLDAVIEDPAGGRALVSAAYRPGSPAALDALAAALADAGRADPPRFVSGVLQRARGTMVIDPIAVLSADGATVPDLAPGDGSAALDAAAPGAAPDPLIAAMAAARSALSEAAHRGLRHLNAGMCDEIDGTANALAGTGLTTTAAAVRAFPKARRSLERSEITRTWVDAQLRLITASELR